MDPRKDKNPVQKDMMDAEPTSSSTFTMTSIDQKTSSKDEKSLILEKLYGTKPYYADDVIERFDDEKLKNEKDPTKKELMIKMNASSQLLDQARLENFNTQLTKLENAIAAHAAVLKIDEANKKYYMDFFEKMRKRTFVATPGRMYGIRKISLEKLFLGLEEKGIPNTVKREVLNALAPLLHVCPDGTTEHIKDAMLKLHSRTSFGECILDYQRRILGKFAIEHCVRNNIGSGDSIHAVILYKKYAKEHFGVKFPEDESTIPDKLERLAKPSPEDIPRLKEDYKNEFTPDNILTDIINQIEHNLSLQLESIKSRFTATTDDFQVKDGLLYFSKVGEYKEVLRLLPLVGEIEDELYFDKELEKETPDPLPDISITPTDTSKEAKIEVKEKEVKVKEIKEKEVKIKEDSPQPVNKLFDEQAPTPGLEGKIEVFDDVMPAKHKSITEVSQNTPSVSSKKSTKLAFNYCGWLFTLKQPEELRAYLVAGLMKKYPDHWMFKNFKKIQSSDKDDEYEIVILNNSPLNSFIRLYGKPVSGSPEKPLTIVPLQHLSSHLFNSKQLFRFSGKELFETCREQNVIPPFAINQILFYAMLNNGVRDCVGYTFNQIYFSSFTQFDSRDYIPIEIDFEKFDIRKAVFNNCHVSLNQFFSIFFKKCTFKDLQINDNYFLGRTLESLTDKQKIALCFYAINSNKTDLINKFYTRKELIELFKLSETSSEFQYKKKSLMRYSINEGSDDVLDVIVKYCSKAILEDHIKYGLFNAVMKNNKRRLNLFFGLISVLEIKKYTEYFNNLFQHAIKLGYIQCVEVFLELGVNLKIVKNESGQNAALILAIQKKSARCINIILRLDKPLTLGDIYLIYNSHILSVLPETIPTLVSKLKGEFDSSFPLEMGINNEYISLIFKWIWTQVVLYGTPKDIDKLYGTIFYNHQFFNELNGLIEEKAGIPASQTLLTSLVQKGKHENVEALVRKSALDINERNKFGYNALHIAVILRNVKCVEKLLIRTNHNINVLDPDNRTWINIAIERNFLDVLKLLLSNKYIQNQFKQIFLSEEKSTSGPSIKASAAQFYKSVYSAISDGSFDTVKYIITSSQDLGIDLNAVYDESSFLMTAMQSGCLEIVKTLLAHPKIDCNISTPGGEWALDMAIKPWLADNPVKNEKEILLALLSHGNIDLYFVPPSTEIIETNDNVITRALDLLSYDLIEIFLNESKGKFDVNRPVLEEGVSPLAYLLSSEFPMKEKDKKDWLRIIELLLKSPALKVDLVYEDEDGCNSNLFQAVIKTGELDAIALFLKSGKIPKDPENKLIKMGKEIAKDSPQILELLEEYAPSAAITSVSSSASTSAAVSGISTSATSGAASGISTTSPALASSTTFGLFSPSLSSEVGVNPDSRRSLSSDSRNQEGASSQIGENKPSKTRKKRKKRADHAPRSKKPRKGGK